VQAQAGPSPEASGPCRGAFTSHHAAICDVVNIVTDRAGIARLHAASHAAGNKLTACLPYVAAASRPMPQPPRGASEYDACRSRQAMANKGGKLDWPAKLVNSTASIGGCSQ
jgi:hypothetical protein